jgi:AcrR family transcriptional regulator
MKPVDTTGRRQRKKELTRRRLADTAFELFRDKGYDAVSVSEIADAADVARPTVFAYFPRKEDLVFDRMPALAAALTDVVERAGRSPIHALVEYLTGPDAPASRGDSQQGVLAFWRLVASSRALQARARELADELERDLARSLAGRGVKQPDVCAALVVGAYRAVHLDAIRRTLAGEPATAVRAERADRLDLALTAAERACAGLQK